MNLIHPWLHYRSHGPDCKLLIPNARVFNLVVAAMGYLEGTTPTAVGCMALASVGGFLFVRLQHLIHDTLLTPK